MSQEAFEKVKGPALALKITAALGVAYCLFNVVVQILGVSIPVFSQKPPEGMEWMTGVSIASAVVGVGVGIFLWLSAVKMERFQAYNQVLIAAILAIVPFCSPCCCITLPVGIWAVIVLSKPEVKAAFGKV